MMAPTAMLRWVEKVPPQGNKPGKKSIVLQQWWTEDVPAYMRADSDGEWRDVPLMQGVAQ